VDLVTAWCEFGEPRGPEDTARITAMGVIYEELGRLAVRVRTSEAEELPARTLLALLRRRRPHLTTQDQVRAYLWRALLHQATDATRARAIRSVHEGRSQGPSAAAPDADNPDVDLKAWLADLEQVAEEAAERAGARAGPRVLASYRELVAVCIEQATSMDDLVAASVRDEGGNENRARDRVHQRHFRVRKALLEVVQDRQRTALEAGDVAAFQRLELLALLIQHLRGRPRADPRVS
jgi:hypothetical protein